MNNTIPDLPSRTKLEDVEFKDNIRNAEYINRFRYEGKNYHVIQFFELPNINEIIAGRYSVLDEQGKIKHCILHMDCCAENIYGKSEVPADIVGRICDNPDETLECLEFDNIVGVEFLREIAQDLERKYKKMREDLNK